MGSTTQRTGRGVLRPRQGTSSIFVGRMSGFPPKAPPRKRPRGRSWAHPRFWHTIHVSILHFRDINEGLLYQRRAGGCTQGDEVVEPTDRRFGLGSKWVTQCFQDPRQPHHGPHPARTHLCSCSSGMGGHGRVCFAFTVAWCCPPGLGALPALPLAPPQKNGRKLSSTGCCVPLHVKTLRDLPCPHLYIS